MNGFYRAADGVFEIVKDPQSALPYSLHWYEWLRSSDKVWEPRAFVTPGEIYTPPRAKLNGFRYRCIVGGQVGSREPEWPVTGSTQFEDGNVQWVLVGTEDTIDSVVVTAGAGLTAGSAVVDATGTVTTFDLSGGTAGSSYTVTVEIETVQGKHEERSFRVKVEQR